MRVGNYTIDPTAQTVVFDFSDLFVAQGEPLALPGVYTISGSTVTYKIQDLPPELGVIL